ncbi:MAG TPA: ribosome biogenesis GTP-binding protein YihA/YsxC [Xanthomonadaceae bacterium]|nr:ribosome biogenesis GTP-binding protein YihA/YsxC [Xanthomonadaceae bacterium]
MNQPDRDPRQASLRAATFLEAAHSPRQIPPDHGREVAFAGRSNAGKSSAVNAITGIKGLARSSKTPGRTQQIVFFDLGGDRRLVDLPGYGYAKVPESLRLHWRELMDGYLRQRRSLAGLVLVMDARHPLKPFDSDMLAWCRDAGLDCHILLTKSDKLSRSEIAKAQRTVVQVCAKEGFRASVQAFSSSKASGVDEARARILGWLEGEPATLRPSSTR